jgi:hypothetical protein
VRDGVRLEMSSATRFDSLGDERPSLRELRPNSRDDNPLRDSVRCLVEIEDKVLLPSLAVIYSLSVRGERGMDPRLVNDTILLKFGLN